MKYDKYKKVDVPWLDEIPEHWEFERAKFYFESKKELNKDNKEKTIMSLTKKGVIDNDIDNPIGSGMPTNDYSKYQLLNKDDLVFNMLDLWYPAFQLARIGIIPKQCAMSPAYIRFCNRDESVVDDYFAYYWYYGLYSQKVFKQLGVGVRESLNRKRLLDIKIAIPPIQEQKLIGNFLDERITKLDKLIKSNSSILDLIKKHQRSYINETLDKTNKIDKIRIKDFCRLSTGNPYKYSYLAYDLDMDEKAYFIRISDLKNGIVDFSKSMFVPLARWEQLKSMQIKNDDLLIAIAGTIGKVAIVKDLNHKATTNQAIMKVDLKNDLTIFKLYLYYVLKSDRLKNWYLGELGAKQTTIMNLYQKDFYNFRFQYPSLDEQIKTANILKNYEEKSNRLIHLLSKKIELLKQLKRSLISEVVTGKINILNLNTNHLDYLNNNIKEDK